MKRGHVCRGIGLWEEVGYMGASGNRDSQLASRSVLENFTDFLGRQFIPKWDKCVCDGGYNISAGGTYRRGRVVMGNLEHGC